MLLGVLANGRAQLRFLTRLALLQLLAGYLLQPRGKGVDALAKLTRPFGEFARDLTQAGLVIGLYARKNRLGSVRAPILQRGEPLLISLSFL